MGKKTALQQYHTLHTTGRVGMEYRILGRLRWVGRQGDKLGVKGRQRDQGRLVVLGNSAHSHSCGMGFSEWAGNGLCPVQSEMAPGFPWLSHFCTVLSWAKHWRLLAHLPLELKLGSAPASTLQRFVCPPCLANSYSLVPRQELSWVCAVHSVTYCVPTAGSLMQFRRKRELAVHHYI